MATEDDTARILKRISYDEMLEQGRNWSRTYNPTKEQIDEYFRQHGWTLREMCDIWASKR